MNLGARVVALRTARLHLDAQVAAGTDTPRATLAQATAALIDVEHELSDAEAAAREHAELAYLFPRCR